MYTTSLSLFVPSAPPWDCLLSPPCSPPLCVTFICSRLNLSLHISEEPFISPAYKQLVNLSARYLVNKRNVLLLLCLYIPSFFCFSVTLSLFYPVFVLLLPSLNLILSQSGLVILSTAKAVIIIMNYEFWILH